MKKILLLATLLILVSSPVYASQTFDKPTFGSVISDLIQTIKDKLPWSERLVGVGSTFPTSLNSWTTGNTITSAWANALESKIGVDNSAVRSSLDFKVNSLIATTSLPNLSFLSAQVSDLSATINAYLHASTTVAKAYSANTFTGTNVFTQKVTVPNVLTSDTDKATNVAFVLAQTSAGVASSTNLIAGKTKLSVAAVDPDNPIAVGDNDTRIANTEVWIYDATIATTTLANRQYASTTVSTGWTYYKVVYRAYNNNYNIGSTVYMNLNDEVAQVYTTRHIANSGQYLSDSPDTGGWHLSTFPAKGATTTPQVITGEYVITNATTTQGGLVSMQGNAGWPYIWAAVSGIDNAYIGGTGIKKIGLIGAEDQYTEASTTIYARIYHSNY